MLSSSASSGYYFLILFLVSNLVFLTVSDGTKKNRDWNFENRKIWPKRSLKIVRFRNVRFEIFDDFFLKIFFCLIVFYVFYLVPVIFFTTVGTCFRYLNVIFFIYSDMYIKVQTVHNSAIFLSNVEYFSKIQYFFHRGTFLIKPGTYGSWMFIFVDKKY